MDLKRASHHASLGQIARERIRRSGFTARGYRIWTEKEDEILRARYPDYDALLKALPGRTYCAIQVRVRALGIAKKRKTWTSKDASILRRNYSTQPWAVLYELLPGYTQNEIRSYAKTMMGLSRAHLRCYVPSGYPAIDAIRARAKELNLSLSDVDKMAGTKRYFQTARWRSSTNLNGKAVARAVKALDGHLEVVWN